MYFNIIEVEETESTNIEILALSYAGAGSGTVVVAEKQTGGRGRSGRTWQSGEGNLLFSLLLKPDCLVSDAAEISYIAAISMRRAITELFPLLTDITFKWPNDILINGKKMCGLLLESSLQNNRVVNLIMGVGVNVKTFPSEGVDYPATSIFKETGLSANPRHLLDKFLSIFAADYECWRKEGFAKYHEIWLNYAAGRGQKITVRTMQETLEGFFQDISPTGSLVLRLENGEIKYINTGDVYFKRTMTSTAAA